MREVFIISTGQIIKGKTAGSQRVMNIAKSLAAGGVNVYLASYCNINNKYVASFKISQGIYNLGNINTNGKSFLHLFRFLGSVNRFVKSRNSENVIYLYPTVFVLKDFIYLLYFKIIKGFKFYCDINELRSASVFSSSPPLRILQRFSYYIKSFYDYLSYRLNELQVLFYDGIVVISSNLEEYFSRRAKKIIKVPILCDLTKTVEAKPANHFDNTVFRICFAGYIKCEKEGFDILFEALCQVNLKRNVELYLYGILTAEDKDILNHLIETTKLKGKVFYMGNIEPDDLSREFSKYHLLILPRPLTPQTKYGFSTKLSEYLISGVPVLLTDVSDNAIYIKDNYNGFMIAPGSSSLMVNKILEIIENYNDNSSMIGENAFHTARERFDNRLFSQTFIDFFFHG
jgi:glycosyltransferase involved in cell wall biosynthesis